MIGLGSDKHYLFFSENLEHKESNICQKIWFFDKCFLQNQLLTNFEGLIANSWFCLFPVFFNLCPHIIACMHAHAIRNICRKATSPSPNINIASAPIVAFVIIVLSAIGPHNPKANALESNKIQGDRGRMMVWAQFGKLPGHTTASQVYWPIKQMCSAVKLWKISKGGNFNNHHRILLDPRHKKSLYKYKPNQPNWNKTKLG